MSLGYIHRYDAVYVIKPSLCRLSFGKISQQFVRQLERDNCTHFSENAYPRVQFKRVQPDLVYAFVTVHDFLYMTRKNEMARIKPTCQSYCSISCRLNGK